MRRDRFILEVRPFGNNCDFACPHCYQPKYATNPILDPRCLVVALEAIAQLYPAVRIVFHGGEPISDGGIWILDAIQRIEQRSLQFGVSYLVHTSGKLMPVNLDILESRGVLFGLSLVPSDIRLSYFLLPPLVGAVCEAGLCAGIQIVLTSSWPTTITDIRKVVSLLPIGKNVKFIPCMGIDRAGSHGISGEEYGKALMALKQIADEDSLWGKHFLEPLTWCRNVFNPIEGFKGCRFEPGKCSLQTGEIVSLAIDSDGTLYPCNRFAALKELPLGSIHNKYWWSQAAARLQEHRSLLGKAIISGTHCKSCDAYKYSLCSGAGGCPFHKRFLDGNSQRKDPFCLGEETLLMLFLNDSQNHG